MGNLGKGVGNVDSLVLRRISQSNVLKSLLKLDPPQATPQGTSYKLAILYIQQTRNNTFIFSNDPFLAFDMGM